MRAPQGAQATARPSVHMVQPARISVRCPRFAGICSFSCVYMWICGWFAGRAQCREWAVPSGSAPVRRGLAACSPSRNLLSRLASRYSRLPSRYSRLTPGVCCVLQVIAQALSRAQKEEQVSKLVPMLEESSVVVGLRYQGLTVKQMQQFRRSLPAEGATLMVCKNTLMKNAADQVEGWENLKPAAKGDNVWLFIQEEQIAESIKAYLKFVKETKEELPKEEREAMHALRMTGGVMSGDSLTDADIKRLESMPTKTELIATIARLLNQLPTKVAIGVKQVPTKLAYGVKALADADDNKDAVVGDVLPKPE